MANGYSRWQLFNIIYLTTLEELDENVEISLEISTNLTSVDVVKY
jgi:hypothetical protein